MAQIKLFLDWLYNPEAGSGNSKKAVEVDSNFGGDKGQL